MKKVLFVIPTLRMGGAEKALVSLLNSLDPNRIKADVFLFEHGGVLQNQLPDWVNVLPEDTVTRAMTLELRTYWCDLLKKGRISAAAARLWISIRSPLRAKMGMKPVSSWKTVSRHIPSLPGRYDAAVGFLEGFADFFALDKTDASRRIAWIHSDLGTQQITAEDAERYRQFDSVATITEACRESFAGSVGVSKNNVSVIKNIVSRDQILKMADAEDPDWKEGIAHIVTVGRLEYQKGSDIGLEACRVLAEKNTEFCWHFIGTGSLMDKLRNKALQYGLLDRCVYEGQKENPYPYMKRAEILVQPSRVEGKSIVLDEAKILGKAIVAADYPSVSDQIENGVTGIVAKTSPEVLAESIIRLIDDVKLRQTLEKNAGEAALDTTEAELERLYALIEA
ncbi:MAG: glycosyltransferase [Clostridia bacterium]|nr:glycosyltransferase [Clostridia bacterium]